MGEPQALINLQERYVGARRSDLLSTSSDYSAFVEEVPTPAHPTPQPRSSSHELAPS